MEATTKFRDIKARHRSDIETIELDTFRTSLTNIEHRKARIFAALHAQNVDTITRANAKARELQDTPDEKDHGQREATSPRRDLDTDSSVTLDPNQTRTPNMSSLPNLKSRLRSKIHTI